MDVYRLSVECKSDLTHIYEYGIENFGLGQAQDYIIGLHELFQTLAENVNLGRDASEFFPALRRLTYKSHMIFYLHTNSGVFIIRTLSQSMDYEQHIS